MTSRVLIENEHVLLLAVNNEGGLNVKCEDFIFGHTRLEISELDK